MTGSRAYRGERCMGGQPVYTPDGDVLDKHLHVLRRAPGGFDWGPQADEARIDQLAVALLTGSAIKKTSRSIEIAVVCETHRPSHRLRQATRMKHRLRLVRTSDV